MKKYIILAVSAVLLLLVVASGWYFLKNKSINDASLEITPVTQRETALDVSLDFYNSWLHALQSTTTDPYQAGLLDNPILSPEVRAEIERKRSERKDGDLEPVLCQPETPKRVGGKEIYVTDTKSQIMMLARGMEVKSTNQAIVTLEVVDNAWQIKKIECSQGETAPGGEFDFDHIGNLLKQSVQPPLDSSKWHLVFEENGEAGHVTPLTFDASTLCVDVDGVAKACNMEQLNEGLSVRIQADMTEEGAIVKKLYFQ